MMETTSGLGKTVQYGYNQYEHNHTNAEARLQKLETAPVSRSGFSTRLTGHGAAIDTTTPCGKLVFGIFAALAEFERELISERTKAGLVSARSRGRKDEKNQSPLQEI